MGIVQQNSGTFNGTSFTPTLGATTQTGNTVYLIVAGNTTVTTPTNWTLRTSQVNFMGHYAYSRTGVALSSVSVSNASGQGTWWLFEVNGAYDTSTSANSSSPATTYSTPALTPASGTRSVFASIASTADSGSTVRTVSGWTSSFVEQIDLCQATADAPMQGGAVLADITANGTTSYSTSATYSAASAGRSAIILSSASSAGGGGPTLITGTDAATVTDTAAETATASRTDTGTVTDASTPANLLAMLDAATVGDTITVAPAVPVADVATVTDTRSSSATAALVDSGALVDASSSAATLARTDTGAVADASTVSVAGVTVSAVDAGALTELAVSTAVLALADLTTLAELVALAGTDTATDSGALADAGVVTVAGTSPAVTDAGTLAEAVLLAAVVAAADVSVVAELFTATASTAVVDAAVQGDTSGLAASAFRAVADVVTLAELVATTAGGALAELLAVTDEPLLVLATLAGVDAVTMGELGLVGLPAADVPPLLVVAAGRDARWRAVGRVLQRYAASGRGGRYSARGIEGS